MAMHLTVMGLAVWKVLGKGDDDLVTEAMWDTRTLQMAEAERRGQQDAPWKCGIWG